MLKMERHPSPPNITAFRVALADCAAAFCQDKSHTLTADDMTLAVFQLAATMAFSRGGCREHNMEWALKNFVANLALLHDAEIEVQIDSAGIRVAGDGVPQ